MTDFAYFLLTRLVAAWPRYVLWSVKRDMDWAYDCLNDVPAGSDAAVALSGFIGQLYRQQNEVREDLLKRQLPATALTTGDVWRWAISLAALAVGVLVWLS